MIRVHVALASRSYEVVIGRGLIDRLAAFVRATSGTTVVITDSNVGEFHGANICNALGARRITVPAGEATKSLEWIERVYDELLAPRDLDRKSTIVALGGGVVGDLAGFAAATLFRGVRWVQVPTTLLAMVDSSVGGKTAINHTTGKNLIGAFHQPRAVFCDLDFLGSLPPREYVSALAEVVKTAALGDSALLRLIEARADAILARESVAVAEIVEACVRFKAAVVAEDETDTTGRRAVLNFGHTVAHALEHIQPRTWLHGEAVAVGIAAALRLSVQRAGLHALEARRITDLLKRFGLPVDVPQLDADALAQALLSDKKRGGNAIRFVVLRALGKPELLECPVDAELTGALLGPRNA